MDSLTNFLFWFLNSRIGIINNFSGIIAHEGVVTIPIYRNGQFQVEMVTILPNRPPWPGEHRHPHVDSYEVGLPGIAFTKNGKELAQAELIVPVQLGPETFVVCGCIRLFPTDFHGIKDTPQGGLIMSVQKWEDGTTPTSVGNDWIGEPSSEGHKKILVDKGNSAVI